MKVKQARENIIEALQKATFSTAGFGFADKKLDYTVKHESQLYRESWLIPPLMQALRAIDPCKICKGRGYVYPDTERISSAKCEPCKGTGIENGLSFDPYQLSHEAVKEAQARLPKSPPA